MDIFHMSDVISLIGLPYPPSGHSTYNIPCPCCDDKPGKKHLNINLKKDVFRCPRCGFPAAFLFICSLGRDTQRRSQRSSDCTIECSR